MSSQYSDLKRLRRTTSFNNSAVSASQLLDEWRRGAPFETESWANTKTPLTGSKAFKGMLKLYNTIGVPVTQPLYRGLCVDFSVFTIGKKLSLKTLTSFTSRLDKAVDFTRQDCRVVIRLLPRNVQTNTRVIDVMAAAGESNNYTNEFEYIVAPGSLYVVAFTPATLLTKNRTRFGEQSVKVNVLVVDCKYAPHGAEQLNDTLGIYDMIKNSKPRGEVEDATWWM